MFKFMVFLLACAADFADISATFVFSQFSAETSVPVSFQTLMNCDVPNKKPLVLMSLLPHPTTFPFEARAYLALNRTHYSF